MMDRDTKTILAARKATLFNDRYARGDRVMHIHTPGCEPQIDRVFGRAHVVSGESVVELAGRAGLVPTDQLYAMPQGSPAQGRRGGWILAGAFALGAAAAVLLALAVPPARSTPPGHIVIDCDEPSEVATPARRVQA